ncbi:energy-coupling factor transporter ATPase [Parasporobacterium paucivorans]|uniref:Energy-coupling factor transport system ATP-binding protein n=1 Tax=Parasporobacterium paucivorans DSM 15970 TaxID=1122934 RepID=A0A1M6BLK9_9FIRM|nr:energy-coupling factor transporter ATPase [Parasporobacterium paucivorans]SHI49605.1 energy-coupling factor transport system ATP-binding protein [Parasporobacterium paucivorans DSM 15970]
MSIIKSTRLVYDYVRLSEDEKSEEISRAINGVDIEVLDGEFIAILGHNGSGKSTFAKHINALLTPTEGTLWLDGMDTQDREFLWQIRQTAGMVFQNPDNQIIGTVVEEDVGFGPENMGIETGEIWNRVNDALEAVDMNAFRKKSPNKLSGGQKQRVAIAGVLAMKPKCIVLDEPTAMLDPLGRKEVLQTVRELNRREKVTVIYITHNMEEVIHADRVIVMDGGQIRMQGTPGEIFSKVTELKSLGLEVPAVTELAYCLKEKGLQIREGILTIDELVDEVCRLSSKI